MTQGLSPTITRLKLPAVRAWVESQSWAIDKSRGLALLDTLAFHAQGGAFTQEYLAAVRAEREARTARSGDGRQITKSGGMIAVLPLYGPIAQRMDLMMDLCGGTSAERFADEFDAAMADPNVSAIVIDCDSPGGSVAGTPELAARIFAARGKGKKLIAVSNSCMASAAYWICSACDEIVASPSADTGSIGVFTVHVDESGMNEMLGLKYTLIKAGEHKAEGNPWEPLEADAESFIQGQIDEMYGAFVGAVAKHRGLKASDVNANFGQGRCFTAKQAKAVGMIDRIDTLENVLKKLGAKDVGMSGRPVRAFGKSGAVAAGGGEGATIAPHLLLSATRADGIDPDEDEDELCPECSAPMDGNACTKCDYTTPSADSGDDDDEPSARAGGAAASSSDVPDDRPEAAKEHSVVDTNTALVGAEAAAKAERERAKNIRVLGQKHRLTAEQIDAMVDEGISYEAATQRILGHIEARGSAAPTVRVSGMVDREADRQFANAGEQLFAIVQAGRGRGVDARLKRVNHSAMQVDRAGFSEVMAGTPSGMNETVGSEGGFFIAPEVLPGVIEPIYTDDPLLSRVTRIPIGSSTNRVVYNVVDESARTDGNRWGGIQVVWGDEADTASQKKPKMRQVEHVLKKLIGIGYLTDEMLEDAPASQTLLVNAFQTEVRFMIANGIFRGKGGGQMVGFLNGKGGVTQAIEATQTIANTSQFISQNVSKMLANIPGALWGDVMFLYNQELFPSIINATIGAGAGTVPLFIGMGGLANRPNDTILGRSAAVSELCEAPGTIGDLVAIAPSQYHVAEKGGAQVATSLHVRFLNDEMTLRITYRIDGKPVWNTTVTPFKGANARGFFSTLNTRS